MKTKKPTKSGKSKTQLYDPQKEVKIKELCAELASKGYSVRREELKRGLGWRAMSGTCRAIDQKLVFIDRRLSQNEQIEFLTARLATVEASALT